MITSLNIADFKHFWEQGGGETKGGHFNEALYLRFLTYFNARYES